LLAYLAFQEECPFHLLERQRPHHHILPGRRMLDRVQESAISPGGTKGGSNHWTVCSHDLIVYEQPVLGVGRQFDDEISAVEPQIRQVALVPVG
jgi:hypothetical protein